MRSFKRRLVGVFVTLPTFPAPVFVNSTGFPNIDSDALQASLQVIVSPPGPLLEGDTVFWWYGNNTSGGNTGRFNGPQSPQKLSQRFYDLPTITGGGASNLWTFKASAQDAIDHAANNLNVGLSVLGEPVGSGYIWNAIFRGLSADVASAIEGVNGGGALNASSITIPGITTDANNSLVVVLVSSRVINWNYFGATTQVVTQGWTTRLSAENCLLLTKVVPTAGTTLPSLTINASSGSGARWGKMIAMRAG